MDVLSRIIIYVEVFIVMRMRINFEQVRWYAHAISMTKGSRQRARLHIATYCFISSEDRNLLFSSLYLATTISRLLAQTISGSALLLIILLKFSLSPTSTSIIS